MHETRERKKPLNAQRSSAAAQPHPRSSPALPLPTPHPQFPFFFFSTPPFHTRRSPHSLIPGATLSSSRIRSRDPTAPHLAPRGAGRGDRGGVSEEPGRSWAQRGARRRAPRFHRKGRSQRAFWQRRRPPICARTLCARALASGRSPISPRARARARARRGPRRGAARGTRGAVWRDAPARSSFGTFQSASERRVCALRFPSLRFCVFRVRLRRRASARERDA